MLFSNESSRHRALAGDLLICAVLVAVGIASRELLESWPNFKPVGAICIWAGLLVSRMWLALLVPPVMMLISDFGMGPAGLGLAFAVQAALIANLYLFRRMRNQVTGATGSSRNGTAGPTASRIGWGAILMGAGSVQFYLTTNFAVWATTSWYSPDLSGLASCYIAAIPFFWNTLLGDFLFGWTPLVVLQVSRAIGFARKPVCTEPLAG